MKFNSVNGKVLRKVCTFVLVGTMAANVAMTSSQVGADALVERRIASIGLGDYTDEDVKKYRRELMARTTSSGDEMEHLKIKGCKPKVYTKRYNVQEITRVGYPNF